MASCDSSKLPQINFSGLSLANSGSEEWTTVRSQVMRSLSELTGFEIVYDKITSEIREAVFGKALKELFALPNEAKIRTSSPEKPHNDYINVPGSDYEALGIPDCTVDRNLDKFVGLLWGEKGNPAFRDIVYNFMMLLTEVDQMVRKMIFEGFGVEKYFDKHLDSYEHYMRVAHYGPPKTPGQPANAMDVHTDMTLTSILCQHEEEGLEILTKDGSWITPSRNSLTFFVGDELSVLCNGQLEPTIHRVTMRSNGHRYITNYSSIPKNETVVQPPEELVDTEHPLMFKPFYHSNYLRFLFLEEGIKFFPNALKVFSGISTTAKEGKVEAN